ncbi:histidine phosphatase family protein [Fructilactobacillus myrtifloralis]|uniref:Histidine phosphatase family protein n=1 Tax=Fructilactobacillus myrtifloralis TaxID=2940301 RepID=A0ABY5BR25_9LACO|nr:histidine phosphatase family protein [Fructilactobacillus myrtifloralis]USS85508.1 histidine phosphatase family protein [Fructilactobacillus myrtifloralis]
MKLYFVRHGKTEWNLESRYQGAGGDSELLPASYQEMQLVGNYLKDIPFAHVYASPIKRARITAGVIQSQLQHPAPLSLDNRLEEFRLGKFEGMKFADAEAQYPETFNDFRNHPDQYDPTPIGGESFPDLIKRMRSKINEITTNFDNDAKLLIVSHGAALNALINSLLGIPLKDLRKRGGLANTSTTILETTDHGQSFKLLDWNDTSYLDHPVRDSDLV